MSLKRVLICALCGTLLASATAMSYAAGDRATAAPAPFRLVSPEKEKRLRALLPTIEDVELQRILEDDLLLLYTDEEMPPAYQDWNTGLPGIHSPSYNISANGSEPFGNGNREFPWNVPGGTHRTTNVSAFRFLWLPQGDDGRRLPIVWYRTNLPGDSRTGYAWRYPVGTIFGEVLLMQAPDKKKYPFELRVRIREQARWSVDAYRPFRSPSQLAQRIRQEQPEWEANESLVKLVTHLESPVKMKRHTMADRHPHVTFRAAAGVDALPPIADDALVATLLRETTFQSVLGEVWRSDEKGLAAFAPTTSARFHIVPAKYDGGMIEVSSESCMRCHETVNRHVNNFDFGRDWYGRVRGSDGIFSFHPFDPASVSYNGIGTTVQMNGRLEQAGLLAPYSSEKHPAAIYHRVPKLH